MTKTFGRIISLILVLMMISSASIYALSVDTSELDFVGQDINGALLGDLESGTIIYGSNLDEAVALASITKLMTYTLLMDYVTENNVKMDEEIEISSTAANTWGSHFGMVPGEKIKLETLMDALLIVSGNDVAVALAEYVAGSESKFVDMMNEKAEEIGLTTATFINPSGLPENRDPDQNYMSVRDLFTFVRYLLSTYPQVLEITKNSELDLPERNFYKKATNPLFGEVHGVDGLKTGYTDKAGICLVSTLNVKSKFDTSKDYRIVSIVMGCTSQEERIEKSKALLDFGRNNFVAQHIANKDNTIGIAEVPNGAKTEIDVYAAENYDAFLPVVSKLKDEIIFNEEIEAPLKKGDKVGVVNYYCNDELIKTCDLVVQDDLEKAGFFTMILRFFQNLF